MALVIQTGNLCQDNNRGSASLLIMLDILAVFDTSNSMVSFKKDGWVGSRGYWWFYSYLTG